jgi:hypothetical protein
MLAPSVKFPRVAAVVLWLLKVTRSARFYSVVKKESCSVEKNARAATWCERETFCEDGVQTMDSLYCG